MDLRPSDSSPLGKICTSEPAEQWQKRSECAKPPDETGLVRWAIILVRIPVNTANLGKMRL
jgi:hypothetical protein